MSRSPITGDKLESKLGTKENQDNYSRGWDAIEWNKKNKEQWTPKVEVVESDLVT